MIIWTHSIFSDWRPNVPKCAKMYTHFSHSKNNGNFDTINHVRRICGSWMVFDGSSIHDYYSSPYMVSSFLYWNELHSCEVIKQMDEVGKQSCFFQKCISCVNKRISKMYDKAAIFGPIWRTDSSYEQFSCFVYLPKTWISRYSAVLIDVYGRL